jgi:tRNA(Arg) A34 adenosine deaminase TadA
MDDAQVMERCIELARTAAARGNQPYGSAIVMDGRIIAEGENSVVTELDPTAHAEIVAIRRACRELGRLDLSGGTIYASGEPCWTCSSAIRGTRVSRVVFAEPSGWATGGYTSDFPILRVEGVAGIGPAPEVVVGVLGDRASALFAELGWPPAER